MIDFGVRAYHFNLIDLSSMASILYFTPLTTLESNTIILSSYMVKIGCTGVRLRERVAWMNEDCAVWPCDCEHGGGRSLHISRMHPHAPVACVACVCVCNIPPSYTHMRIMHYLFIIITSFPQNSGD